MGVSKYKYNTLILHSGYSTVHTVLILHGWFSTVQKIHNYFMEGTLYIYIYIYTFLGWYFNRRTLLLSFETRVLYYMFLFKFYSLKNNIKPVKNIFQEKMKMIPILL